MLADRILPYAEKNDCKKVVRAIVARTSYMFTSFAFPRQSRFAIGRFRQLAARLRLIFLRTTFYALADLFPQDIHLR